MSRRVIITASARLEIAEAVRKYEEQRPSVGVRFWIEFKNLAQRLKQFPEIYMKFGKRGVRKATMHKFPYVVYYRIAGKELRILGVLHGAMNPDIAKSRFS